VPCLKERKHQRNFTRCERHDQDVRKAQWHLFKLGKAYHRNFTRCFFNRTTVDEYTGENFEIEQLDDFTIPQNALMRLGHHHGAGVDKVCFGNADQAIELCSTIARGCGNYAQCYDQLADQRNELVQAEAHWEDVLDACLHG